MTGNAASLERLFWDGMIDNSLERGTTSGFKVGTCFAASMQRDFDLSKITEFLYG